MCVLNMCINAIIILIIGLRHVTIVKKIVLNYSINNNLKEIFK